MGIGNRVIQDPADQQSAAFHPARQGVFHGVTNGMLRKDRIAVMGYPANDPGGLGCTITKAGHLFQCIELRGKSAPPSSQIKLLKADDIKTGNELGDLPEGPVFRRAVCNLVSDPDQIITIMPAPDAGLNIVTQQFQRPILKIIPSNPVENATHQHPKVPT